MPIVAYTLPILRELLDKIDADPERTNRVACLGYPDVIVKPKEVERVMRVTKLARREDSEAILNWHKAKDITSVTVDAKDMFAACGYEMQAFDKVKSRGHEITCDLSHPLRQGYDHQFDLVFDIISNQCFNVAQAIANAASLCRIGGYVFHQIPVQMVNQGFWNVSPAAFYDFYRVNGFEFVQQFQIVGVYAETDRLSLDVTKRVRDVPDDTINMVVVKKVKAFFGPKWPMMTKFEIYPECKR